MVSLLLDRRQCVSFALRLKASDSFVLIKDRDDKGRWCGARRGVAGRPPDQTGQLLEFGEFGRRECCSLGYAARTRKDTAPRGERLARKQPSEKGKAAARAIQFELNN